MNVEPLYLTSKDILLLKNKEIGRGTDGVVYKATKDYLYKIYYNSYEKKVNSYPSDYQTILDKDGVNIADNRKVFRKKVDYNKYQINYYNDEGVKLGGIESVYKAIERQQEIHRTKLQMKPIFVDYHFQGTVLHYHK